MEELTTYIKGDVPPNHRLIVLFLSIASHPQDGVMSPKKGLSLLVVHYPHTIAQNQDFYSNRNSNPSTLFPLNLHNLGNGIPFSSMQSLKLSHFPSGI